MTRTTLSVMVLAAMFVAGCASNAAGARLQGAAVSAPAAAEHAGNGTSPSGASEPATAAPSVPAASGGGSPSVVSPVRPTQCPPFTANLLGCPIPYPLPVVIPPSSHARILVCPPSSVGDLIGRAAAVCGAGFHAGEMVTITVVGRLGSTSWQSTARPDGTFRSLVPAAACRLIPIYANARGNRGSVANAVAISPASCRLTA